MRITPQRLGLAILGFVVELSVVLAATSDAMCADSDSKTTWREAFAASAGDGFTQALAQAKRQFPDDRQQLDIVTDWLRQDGLTDKTIDSTAVAPIIGALRAKNNDLVGRLEKLQAANPPAGDPAWVGLYLDACEARRRARLAPCRELLSRIVFTKHYTLGGSHYAYTEGQSDAQKERHFRPGASLCALAMDDLYGREQTLLEDAAGVIRDPDVSYDGRRILFAWKKSLDDDDYHLYEMTLDDGQIRQLTSGKGFADYEGAYLPDGHIVFSSTRCVQTVDCWWTEVSNLFTCDGDGRYLRQLGYDQVHTSYPTVTHDGRVIYTRWDYSDRGQIYPQGLFQMNPDGTGQTEVYGNNSFFPTTILHARSIPGTSKVVAVFTGHHTRQKGKLGILDPRLGRQENQGAQLIAPVRDTPAERIDQYGQHGDQFQYPYPLSEADFLVTYQPEGAKRFGVYFMTIDGQRELLVDDPSVSCSQPLPLRPRIAPPQRPLTPDYAQDTAAVYLHDIYTGPGLAGIERGAIKALRIVALEFRAAGVGQNGNSGPAGGALVSTPVSIQGTWDVKRVLGTAKVHDDGSACFEIPARTPVYFQALDGQGQMVQSMRSWTTLQPGEVASCVGCHEHKNTAPPVTVATQAMRRGPQPLQPFHDSPRGFSFVREIQPILDQHCVCCHHLDQPPSYLGGKTAGSPPNQPTPEKPEQAKTDSQGIVAAFSLKGTQRLDEKAMRSWSDSYRALAHRQVANWINIQSGPAMLPPYHAGASQSKLVAMLRDGSHYDAKLDRAELDRIVTWIDLLVPYAGDYTEAMAEEGIPRYTQFLEKRHRWRETESQNIAELLQTRE